MTTDYSQSGEQSIIADILANLKYRDYQLVDVGAGDGVTLSNTRALVEDAYIALLIEADPAKYTALVKSLDALKNDGVRSGVDTLNATVTSSGECSLEALLDDGILQPNFDFLSIDIDGNDYHIWASLKNYRPKLVCIEFNPTMPVDLDYVQPEDTPPCGSSLLALTRLAATKGYALSAVTVTNALYVRDDLCAHLDLGDNSIHALWADRRFLTRLFWDYCGNGRVAGNLGCPWGVGVETQ